MCMDSMQVLSLCTNLGTPRPPCTHPASTRTANCCPEAQRQAAGIGQGLIRVAVGLEHFDDITGRPGAWFESFEHEQDSHRIAPSPPVFCTWAPARTALYLLAHARHFGGEFVLRIEDTDVGTFHARFRRPDPGVHALAGPGIRRRPVSTRCSAWDRYKAGAGPVDCRGQGLPLLQHPEELDAVREREEGRAARRPCTTVAGAWRPARPCRPCRKAQPVIRFCNPLDGDVTWDDLVKGPITISNREIDDLIIARTDGIPTYNFAVVVDDWGHGITHVFRGDEHVNNTPWQINIFRALGALLPQFGHCPVILGDDGQSVQAPWRRERDLRTRGALPARGHAQLPGAPGLEPW